VAFAHGADELVMQRRYRSARFARLVSDAAIGTFHRRLPSSGDVYREIRACFARGDPSASRRMKAVFLASLWFLVGCGSSSPPKAHLDDPGETSAGGSGTAETSASSSGTAGAGGGSAACTPVLEGDTIRLAAGAHLDSGVDQTMCLRWTTPEDLDISGFLGTLGPGGHHALLIAQSKPNKPDGLAACSEAEIMDASAYDLNFLAGVSYESSGKRFDFPSVPVQVGLHVPKGTQLIFDAHLLNAASHAIDACATLDLDRGAKVIAALNFRTILPKEEFALTVPAHDSIDVSYEVPVAAKERVAATISHMHDGGTHFRLSVKETNQTLYETNQWADPTPTIDDKQKVVLDPSQTLRIECSFTNNGGEPQHFPAQMCVGAMYVLSCLLPGAC
jgi:hypothetical protein